MRSLSFTLLILTLAPAHAQPILVEGGLFRLPLLLDETETAVWIDSFLLDATQVTNEQFLAFVRAEPHWQRGAAPQIFVDSGYLTHWSEPLTFGEGAAAQPVTRVSWFAARAYCAGQGGRLPTMDEWEYASAREREASGLSGSEYAHELFAWYSNPTAEGLAPVGESTRAVLGVHDLHGLVLEWVEDFQLLMAQGDSTDLLASSCGDTARFLPEFDEEHYATFLRYQSRSNYTARTTTNTLGFRCAYDVEKLQ